MNSSARARKRMVEQQLVARGITDARVLEAMNRVPRENFVAEAMASQAYSDSPLPIGEKQTISQPYVVALMSEALQLTGREKVLEIGTGSGYFTAVLALLAARVYSIERHAALAAQARARIEAMHFKNVLIKNGDGTLGWREYAPYDAIVASAAGPDVPPILLEQLEVGGRLVIPLGEEQDQHLYLFHKTQDSIERQDLGSVRFVPLIGRFGWSRTP